MLPILNHEIAWSVDTRTKLGLSQQRRKVILSNVFLPAHLASYLPKLCQLNLSAPMFESENNDAKRQPWL